MYYKNIAAQKVQFRYEVVLRQVHICILHIQIFQRLYEK